MTLCSSNIFNNSNTSALDYSSNVGVGFTFNPTLSVNISPSDLTISNLSPGTTADSNVINVSVASNASYGYTLSAIANGDNSNLTHTNNTSVFSSIAIDADLPSLDTDNTWGYTSKLNNETIWNNYNGLSSSSNAILLDNSNAADSSGNIDFKISAKASSTQPSGEYTNTINFIAVSKVAPMSLLDSFIASGAEQLNGYFKMQDMTHDICESVDVEESELQLIDVRDNKVYWVAKLKDGNCWMTQNLDLDLSHEVALTSETSDIDPESYGTTIYTAETGYSKDKDTGVVSWLPSTIDSEGIQRADTIDMVWSSTTAATVPGWTNDNYKPYSADAGDRYRYTNSSGSEAVYTSLNSCLNGTNNDRASCQHAHLGNYYNWTVAIVSNDSTNFSDAYKSPANSVCPKNWVLPPQNKYLTMLSAQNIIIDYATEGFLKIRTSPLYFIRSGNIDSNMLKNFNASGNYWSSTVFTSVGAYSLQFNASRANAYYYYDRYYGKAVRCLAR